MRFIRKGGRVIPIHDDKQPKYNPAKKTTAALGAASGAAFTGGMFAAGLGRVVKNAKAVKFGRKALIAGVATEYAAIGHALVKGHQARKAQLAGTANVSGAAELSKHAVAGLVGGIAGITAVGAFVGHRVAKGAMKRAAKVGRKFINGR